jgi:hypothetical protein
MLEPVRRKPRDDGHLVAVLRRQTLVMSETEPDQPWSWGYRCGRKALVLGGVARVNGLAAAFRR